MVEVARRAVDSVERIVVAVSEEAVKKIRELTLGTEATVLGQQRGCVWGPNGGGTYAAVAAAVQYSPMHAAALTRGDIKAKQILVDGDRQGAGSAVIGLTEKELLEKATLALQVMPNNQDTQLVSKQGLSVPRSSGMAGSCMS
jgi:hypothetical protein